jgi:hypothetical protein
VSDFVDQCRKEWSRIGVPEATASEMAADLEADLAEARSEGVAPEAVLGNGYFDAKSFAASWALARGVATPRLRRGRTVGLRTLVLAGSSLAAAAIAGLGLLILARPRFGSQSIAAVSARRSINPVIPGPFVAPRRILFEGPGVGLDPLGWILLVAGLATVAVTVWLWKPWREHWGRPGPDQSVGMPSYF